MKNILWVLLIVNITIKAQNIKVIDKITRQPIPGVILFCKTTTAASTTNAEGEAVSSGLITCDTVQIRHINYYNVVLTPKQIENKNFMIELTENKLQLDEITVTANKWEEKKIENPFSVEKIKKKEIEFKNPQTSADLLGAGTNVYIQKSQQAGGSPMTRGFATNRLILVVDGVRMNNSIFRSGNVQNIISLDANSVEEAEVLFGPGAVMYGSDAIGGVIDFHTISPRLSDSGKLSVTGSALARFSSVNKENTGHMDIVLSLNKFASLTSLTYSQYDDLYAGKTGGDSVYLRRYYQSVSSLKDTQLVNNEPSLQVNSKFRQLNLMQKFIYSPNKNLKIIYSLQHSKSSDAPRYDRLNTDANNNGVLDFSEWYYGPQIWHMQNINLQFKSENLLFSHVRVVGAYQYFEESRHDRRFNSSGNSNSNSAFKRHQTEKVNAVSLNIDFDKNINKKSSFFYGAEFVHNLVQSTAYKENIYNEESFEINSRYPSGSTWQTFGIFTNLKHKFKENVIINAGLRYSHYFIMAKFDTSLFTYPVTTAKINNGALNGGIGLVVSPHQKWKLFVNISTGYRAPNIDDIGKVFDSQPGLVIVPNTNLKPEYAYNAEAGTAFHIGNFLKSDASVYYTFLDKAIVRRPSLLNGNDSIMYNGQLSQVQSLQNAGHAYVYGIQGNLEIYLPYGISITNNVSWQQGYEYNNDSLKYFPLQHNAPLFGSSHLIFTYKKIKTDFYINYNGEMRYDQLSVAERSESYNYAKNENMKPYSPSWYTVNFKLALYFNKNTSINFGIENISDLLYRPYSSGISAPGRNYYLGLRILF